MANSNWLISIGAGPSQLSLIRAAQDLGFKVLGVDRRVLGAPANEFIKISTFDTQKVLLEIRKHHLKKSIRGVIARTSGPAVFTAAEISNELGLPGFGKSLAMASVSKLELVKLAGELGIRYIDGRVLEIKPISYGDFELVVKPEQPVAGKLNVFFVNSLKSFEQAFIKASAESLNGRVLVQPFIPGRDIGLVIMTRLGECLWHFFYEELVDLVSGQFKGCGVTSPVLNIHPLSLEEMLASVKIISKKNNTTGFIFASFRVNIESKAFLYELNLGLSGDLLVDKLFPVFWPNVNFYKLDILLMSGGNVLLPTDFRGKLIAKISHGKLNVSYI